MGRHLARSHLVVAVGLRAAARDMYWHYHLLALNRMEGCVALSAGWERLMPGNQTGDFTTFSEFDAYMFEDYAAAAPRYRSPGNTPAHECEREAMVYEMVAQHYLHDAWSTGHMWRRWGYAQFLDYPDTLGPSSYLLDGAPTAEDDPTPPATDVWARRYIIGQVVRHCGAMVSGYQGILLQMGVDELDALSGGVPDVADPLNGPFYTVAWTGEQREVEWVDDIAGASPERGVGDLYYDPSGVAAAHLRSDGLYATQLQRLLTCSARSLRDVYRIGPQRHGEIGPAQPVHGVDPDAIDPIGYCFDHDVTNASMYGALGAYHDAGRSLFKAAFDLQQQPHRMRWRAWLGLGAKEDDFIGLGDTHGGAPIHVSAFYTSIKGEFPSADAPVDEIKTTLFGSGHEMTRVHTTLEKFGQRSKDNPHGYYPANYVNKGYTGNRPQAKAALLTALNGWIDGLDPKIELAKKKGGDI